MGPTRSDPPVLGIAGRCALVVPLALGVVLGTAAPGISQESATLQGRVAADDGEPVEGAAVQLTESRQTLTDERGAFRFSDLAPGEHSVRVEYLGFETARERVRLGEGESGTVSVSLSREAIEVAKLVVEVPSRRRTWVRNQFEGLIRRHGTLLTRREIEERNPHATSDLFRRIPGIHVRGFKEDGFGNRVVVRCHGRSYEPTIYLNGGRMPDFDVDMIPPEEIAALGVVRGISASTRTPGCGAVVIVTRAVVG